MKATESFNKITKFLFLAGILIIILALLIGIIENDWHFQSGLIRLDRDAWLSEVFVCSNPGTDRDLGEPKKIFLISEWQDIYVCGHIQSKKPIILDSIWFHDDEESPIASNPELLVFEPGDFFISFYDSFTETPQRNENFPKVGKYRVLITQGRIEMGEVYFEIIEDD